MLPQGFDHALQQQERNVSPSPAGPSNLFSSARTPVRATTQVFHAAAPLPLASNPSLGTMAQPLASPSSVELATKPVPLYRLSRNVRTIPDLWKEWTIGLGCLPSIHELDRLYGSRWRIGNEIQHYSTRKRIIDEVKRRAGSSATAEDYKAVVREMEEERAHSKASLDKVSKALRTAKM